MTSANNAPGPVAVCRWEICHKFNALDLYGEDAAGRVIRNADREKTLPDGTRIGVYRYWSLRRQLLAIVQYHAEPGRPGPEDPKWLRDGDRAIVPAHDERETCPDCPKWKHAGYRPPQLV